MITLTDGDVAVLTLTFQAPNASGVMVNTDPTTASTEYAVASPSSAPGATTTLNYTGISNPGLNVMARTAEGVYVVWLDTTGQPGVWTVEGVGTGVAQCVSDPPVVFRVQPRAL